MSEIINIETLPLETLAEAINESAEQAEVSLHKAVEHAARCGRYLLAAKSQLPHGEWGKWLGANFDRDPRTAQRYMTLAANTTRVPGLSETTSIRAALRVIADDGKPEPVPEPAREPQQAPEPEAVEDEPETDPQERPSIAVSRPETRKASEADKQKPAPVAVKPVELWIATDAGYQLATVHQIAHAALGALGAAGLRAWIAEQEADSRA